MARQLCPGEIVPESGVYRVLHEPTHVGALCQLRFIRGRRFPGCPQCRSIGFELLRSDEVAWSARRSRTRGDRGRLPKAVAARVEPASKLASLWSALLIAALSGLCWAVIFGIAIGLRA